MIDSSIYGNIGRGVKSVGEFDAEAMQGQQNKLSLMLAQNQMQDAERGRAGENALAQLLGQGKTGADVSTGLAQQGFGKQSMAYTKQSQDMAKDRAAMEKSQLETTMQKLSMGAQLLGGVRDQASYDAARQTAQSNGLDVSRMPPEYNPQFVQQKMLEGQSVKEQLEQKWKAMEYSTPTANSRLQAETSTSNNAATNATSRANNSATVGATMRGQNMVDGRATQSLGLSRERLEFEKTKPVSGAAGAPSKPLPVGALKMRVEAQDAADTAEGINDRLGVVEKRITDKKLDFGPIKNLANSALNAAGMSTESSRNLSSFKSEMEKLRNDSLRLNKGVQTDGDAQRAWNELFQNINDTDLVKQRMTEIKQINARAKSLRLMEVDTINRNYGNTSEAATMKAPSVSVDSLLDKYK